MKRLFALALVTGLLFVGAAGCSSDSDDGGDNAPETTEATDGGSTDDGGSSSGSSEVAEYCDAVDEFVSKAKDVMADPTSADAGTLATESQELVQKGTDLAGNLTAEEAQEVADCTKKATDALTGG